MLMIMSEQVIAAEPCQEKHAITEEITAAIGSLLKLHNEELKAVINGDFTQSESFQIKLKKLREWKAVLMDSAARPRHESWMLGVRLQSAALLQIFGTIPVLKTHSAGDVRSLISSRAAFSVREALWIRCAPSAGIKLGTSLVIAVELYGGDSA